MVLPAIPLKRSASAASARLIITTNTAQANSGRMMRIRNSGAIAPANRAYTRALPCTAKAEMASEANTLLVLRRQQVRA